MGFEAEARRVGKAAAAWKSSRSVTFVSVIISACLQGMPCLEQSLAWNKAVRGGVVGRPVSGKTLPPSSVRPLALLSLAA
jgi:hypothetical protein